MVCDSRAYLSYRLPRPIQLTRDCGTLGFIKENLNKGMFIVQSPISICVRRTQFTSKIPSNNLTSGYAIGFALLAGYVVPMPHAQAQDGMLSVVAPTVAEEQSAASWNEPLSGNRNGASLGRRQDDFNWHISGSNGTPNILSELNWRKMDIRLARLFGEFNVDKVVLFGEFTTGVIADGASQDSDYSGNNRTFEFSRSTSDAGGKVYDASVGVGIPIWFFLPSIDGSAVLTPLFGLAGNYQHMNMTNGVQRIPADGPFPVALDSSYKASWEGPWFGARGEFFKAKRFSAQVRWEYHFGAEYDAVANWNLRSDFQHPVSFRHGANAQGHRLMASVRYLSLPRTEFFVSLDGHWYFTDNGTDITYFSDGTTSKLQLNRAEWDSVGINFGVATHF